MFLNNKRLFFNSLTFGPDDAKIPFQWPERKRLCVGSAEIFTLINANKNFVVLNSPVVEQEDDEALRLILAHTELATLAATIFAICLAAPLLTGALKTNIPELSIRLWLAAKLFIALIRIGHAYVIRMRGFDISEEWKRWTIHLLFFDGVIWGVGGAALMFSPTETWTVVAASLCGVACVATFGFQVSLVATAAYVAPMIGAVAGALLFRADADGLLTGIGLSILLVVMLSTAARSGKRVSETARLRRETERVSAELREALDMAKKHSDAKDRFLAVVSHELRTPLHGILGLTRLMSSELTPAQSHLQYRLELIGEAGQHLQRLVNDLLDISLIEAGRLQLKPDTMDLRRELDLITATYEIRGQEIGVRLAADIKPGLGHWMIGDAARIGQVLHNLLQNAMKFTPLGGTVNLTIDRPAGGESVRFQIKDNGPGIAVDEIESVFDTFVQGTVHGGSRPEGVGLGLAISRQLARAMGGDVVCFSLPTQGSTFIFTAKLPLSAPALPSTNIVPLRANRSLVGLRVFIAEDDFVSTIVHGSTVTKLGLRFEEFADGPSLLERTLVKTERPDLIFMDWDLPRLNGWRATKAIRRYEELHGLDPILIIGLSANVDPNFKAAAQAAGMNTFLTKPCSPDAIARAIRSLVAAKTQ